MPHYQPTPRAWHCAAQVGETSILVGGLTQDLSESKRETLACEIEVFDTQSETWAKKTTAVVQHAPLGLYFCACTVVAETLYHFGGRYESTYYNALRSLNAVSNTQQWEELCEENAADQPMPKSACGIAAYHNKALDITSLAVFAGYGRPADPIKVGKSFVRHDKFSDGRGWTNELHLFNLKNCKWSSPPTTGPRPPPCSFFSFTSINDHIAVMFGGYQPKRKRVNDVYIIDFQSMEWTKLEKPKGAPWPVERELHAACCLNYNDEHPQLLVTGGLDNNRNTLKDAWILDINSGKWKELTLPEGTRARWGHSITFRCVRSGLVRTTTFGGSPKFEKGQSLDDQQKIAETIVMEFESVESQKSSDDSSIKEWVLRKVVSSDELGSEASGLDMVKVKNVQIQTETVQTANQHVQAGSTALQQGYLCGVEVIDHTTFTYTGKAQSIEWLHHGFKLHIPDDALPSNVSECRVHVTASLCGQFQFPENVEQISGIYWIVSPYTFTKPATIEIQHCAAKPDYQQNLKFVVAKCTQEDLPYQFKILDGGVFSPSGQYGSIKLTHFSGVGVVFQSVLQWLGLRSNQPEPNSRCYCAQLYYSSIGVHSWEVYFTVTCDLELHIAAADCKYGKDATKVGPDQEVVFEEEQITLDIKEEGVVLENGWTISPDTYPRITKNQVDRFVPGGRVPSCQLYLKWTGRQEQPVELVHRVKLLGAKEPNNFFLMRPPALQQRPQAPIRVAQQMSKSSVENLGIKYAGLEYGPQLSDLMNEVASQVPAKWRQISIQLGLTPGDQECFMASTPNDPLQCFTSVFRVWKARATRPYTWSTIIEALEAPAVDEKRLAQELRTKIQTQPPQTVILTEPD